MNENISVQAAFQKMEPKILVSPDTLTFESIDPGKKATKALTISNTHGRPPHNDLPHRSGSRATAVGAVLHSSRKIANLKVTYHKPASDEDGMLFSEIDSG